nr:uncharacterized serine-rich protein C215.13-like [Procambarus clarkii]
MTEALVQEIDRGLQPLLRLSQSLGEESWGFTTTNKYLAEISRDIEGSNLKAKTFITSVHDNLHLKSYKSSNVYQETYQSVNSQTTKTTKFSELPLETTLPSTISPTTTKFSETLPSTISPTTTTTESSEALQETLLPSTISSTTTTESSEESNIIISKLESIFSPFIRDINTYKGLIIIPKPPISYNPKNRIEIIVVIHSRKKSTYTKKLYKNENNDNSISHDTIPESTELSQQSSFGLTEASTVPQESLKSVSRVPQKPLQSSSIISTESSEKSKETLKFSKIQIMKKWQQLQQHLHLLIKIQTDSSEMPQETLQTEASELP